MTALYSITLISLSDIQTSGTEHMQREAKQIRSDTNIKPNIKGTQLKVKYTILESHQVKHWVV